MNSLETKDLIFINTLPIINEINNLSFEAESLKPIDKAQENRIMQKFRLDWNYNSNAIEGNSLDYGETVAFLIHGVTAKGKPLKDYLDIRGHNETIDYLLYLIKNKEELSEKDIRSMHQMLLVEPYESSAQTDDGSFVKKTIHIGEYKRMPNHVKTVTGEFHYYASPEDTPILMGELLSWYRLAVSDSTLHPLVIASIFHHRFTSIHPFDDGNGRMSRLLMNLILFQYNYPPVIIKNLDKNEYYLTLSQADNGNIEPFINFIGKNLVNSLNIYIKGARGENIEELSDLKKKLTLFRKEIEARGDKIELKKSPETLKNTAEKSILPFVNELTVVLSDFKDLFFDYGEYFVYYETFPNDRKWHYIPNDVYNKINEVINNSNNDSFEVFCFQFNNFKLAEHSFSVEVKIAVKFNELDYFMFYSFSEARELERAPASVYAQWMTSSLGRRYYHQNILPDDSSKMANKVGEEFYEYIRPIFENESNIFVSLNAEELNSLWVDFLGAYGGIRAEMLLDVINNSFAAFDEQNKTVNIKIETGVYTLLDTNEILKTERDFYKVVNSRIVSSIKIFVDISPNV